MLEKFDYYAALGIIIPGVLLSYWIPVCFPAVSEIVGTSTFPSAVDVISFTALAIFVGNLIQAIASLIEPFVFWTWGGRPSDYAFGRGLGERYLPKDAAQRIRTRLASVVGVNASDRSLFLWAMRRAAATPNSRSERFNSLYAYHRGLLVVLTIMLVLLVVSTQVGVADRWSQRSVGTILVVLILTLVLVWHRAKQWAFYYVREVLSAAEHVAQDLSEITSAEEAVGKG